ncbi:hypothetical protein [uncultured Gimesia sp.]|uniref:hypothetical protein n=1 Tax=uncultured Gimesia sp. TaxID=1678688 RepID=UPI002634D9D5|nr:hypothetical protein [uncultured Gimesia sp.]
MEDFETNHALVEVGCAYWFNDNDEVRSPFPVEIQSEVKRRAQKEILDFLASLTEQDAKAMSDDEMVSIFEGFLFAEGLKLIDQDDQDLALTLNFPFLPRVGDLVNNETKGESCVIERRIEAKEDNKPFMVVVLQAIESKEIWQTEFMLPA